MRTILVLGLIVAMLSGCARAYQAESAYALPRSADAPITDGRTWLLSARRNERDTRMIAFRSRDRDAEAWFEVTTLPPSAGPVNADVAAREFGRALQELRSGPSTPLRKFGLDIQFVERGRSAIAFGDIPGAITRLDLLDRRSREVVARLAVCVTTAVGTVRESRATRDARFLFIGAFAASPSSFERHFPAWATTLEEIHQGFIAPPPNEEAETASPESTDDRSSGRLAPSAVPEPPGAAPDAEGPAVAPRGGVEEASPIGTESMDSTETSP